MAPAGQAELAGGVGGRLGEGSGSTSQERTEKRQRKGVENGSPQVCHIGL